MCNVRSICLYIEFKITCAQDNIGKYQAGFSSGKSTMDQIFVIRQEIEKGTKRNIYFQHLPIHRYQTRL